MAVKTYRAICEDTEGSVRHCFANESSFKEAKIYVESWHKELRVLRIQLLDESLENVLKEVRYSKKVLNSELGTMIENKLNRIEILLERRSNCSIDSVDYSVYSFEIAAEKKAVKLLTSRLMNRLGEVYHQAYLRDSENFFQVKSLFQSVKSIL